MSPGIAAAAEDDDDDGFIPSQLQQQATNDNSHSDDYRLHHQLVTGFGIEVLVLVPLFAAGVATWLILAAAACRRRSSSGRDDDEAGMAPPPAEAGGRDGDGSIEATGSLTTRKATTRRRGRRRRMNPDNRTSAACCPICLHAISDDYDYDEEDAVVGGTDEGRMDRRQRQQDAADTDDEEAESVSCETNCGHVFCVSCFQAYCRHASSSHSPLADHQQDDNLLLPSFSSSGGRVRCPVCRQTVSLLLACFDVALHPAPAALIDRFNSQSGGGSESLVAQLLAGGVPGLVQQLRDLPALLRHLSHDFLTLPAQSFATIVRIRMAACAAAALAYLLSPLDLVPEALFGIVGLVDDAAVLLLLALYVALLYRHLLASRWSSRQQS